MTHEEWDRAIEPLVRHCELDLRQGGDRARVLEFSMRFARTVPFDVFVRAVNHLIKTRCVAIWPGIGQMEQSLRAVGWQPGEPANVRPRRRLRTVARVENTPEFYGELAKRHGGELGKYFKGLGSRTGKGR